MASGSLLASPVWSLATSADSNTSSALLKQIMTLVKSYGSVASNDSADSLLSLQA